MDPENIRILQPKTFEKAPVTQNAEVFESGNNSHLQLFGTRLTPNRNVKADKVLKIYILQIGLKLSRLNCVWWSNVNLFPLYQRKSFSQIERCEVVWCPNLGLLIASIPDDEFGKNLIFPKGWVMYGLSKVEKFEDGGIKSRTWVHSAGVDDLSWVKLPVEFSLRIICHFFIKGNSHTLKWNTNIMSASPRTVLRTPSCRHVCLTQITFFQGCCTTRILPGLQSSENVWLDWRVLISQKWFNQSIYLRGNTWHYYSRISIISQFGLQPI